VPLNSSTKRATLEPSLCKHDFRWYCVDCSIVSLRLQRFFYMCINYIHFTNYKLYTC